MGLESKEFCDYRYKIVGVPSLAIESSQWIKIWLAKVKFSG